MGCPLTIFLLRRIQRGCTAWWLPYAFSFFLFFCCPRLLARIQGRSAAAPKNESPVIAAKTPSQPYLSLMSTGSAPDMIAPMLPMPLAIPEAVVNTLLPYPACSHTSAQAAPPSTESGPATMNPDNSMTAASAVTFPDVKRNPSALTPVPTQSRGQHEFCCY